MAYTVTQLITNAYYLSGIASRELQTVSGDQIFDGLNLLNLFLGVKSAQTRLIPYYTQYNFVAVPNQEQYFIPNLIEVETFTFNIGPVRYSMQPVSRRPYFGAGRIDNIASLPFNWHLERSLGGSSLYVYFLPSSDFPMIIHGKFGLLEVELGQDLELVYDKFYIDYLRYGLAEYICNDYGINFPQQGYTRLKELEAIISDVSPPDLTLSKISSLGNEQAITWAQVNLGKGWTVG